MNSEPTSEDPEATGSSEAKDGFNGQILLQTNAPRRVGLTTALILNAYGLLLILPVLVSFLVVASLPLGWYTYVLPLLAMALGLLVLPFGFGNPYVRKLLAHLKPADAPATTWLVQLTASPRLRSGLRALLEDADDFGWLVVRDGQCEYRGDAIRLAFPLARIARIRLCNGGVRGLFLPSTRIQITLTPGPDTSGTGGTPQPLTFEIAERGSLWLSGFHRASKTLFTDLNKASG